MNRAKEFLIGKKIDNKLTTNCNLDFKESNLLNIFSLIGEGGKGVFKCDFAKGDKSIGSLVLNFTIDKNGVKTHVETTKGLVGALARESEVVEETLGL